MEWFGFHRICIIWFAIKPLFLYCLFVRQNEEDLEEKTKDDRFDFLMANKKKEKFKGDEPEDAVAKKCEAIRWLRADISYYKGAKMEFDAGDMGLFEIAAPKSDPIAQGFTLVWTPDSAKNANGKAKMKVQYK